MARFARVTRCVHMGDGFTRVTTTAVPEVVRADTGVSSRGFSFERTLP
jgi:hypothetical protein